MLARCGGPRFACVYVCVRAIGHSACFLFCVSICVLYTPCVCVHNTPASALCLHCCTHQTHLCVCVCVSWRGPVVCRRGSDRRSRVVGLPLWNVRWHVTTGCMSPISLTGGPHGPPARSRTVWRRGHGPVTCVPSSRQGMPGSRDWNVRRYVLPFPFFLFSFLFKHTLTVLRENTQLLGVGSRRRPETLYSLCLSLRRLSWRTHTHPMHMRLAHSAFSSLLHHYIHILLYVLWCVDRYPHCGQPVKCFVLLFYTHHGASHRGPNPCFSFML